MNFPKEHELHQRRKGRNLGLGLVLVAFVAIVFGLTVVKVSDDISGAIAGEVVGRGEIHLPPSIWAVSL